MKSRRQNGEITTVGQASRLSDDSWRRHLPHFQCAGQYYFITFVTLGRRALTPPQKDCVFDAIHFWDGTKYDLLAAVVMDDHVHILIRPIESLSKIMHSIKSFTAHQINKNSDRKGKLWQDENLDRIVRSDQEFLTQIEYIANSTESSFVSTI